MNGRRHAVSDRAIAGRVNARLGRAAGVLLIGGAAEPLYLPPSGRRPALIRYTRDHAASALHELAHWCLAPPDRRNRVDYGLWYLPPPRRLVEQARFYVAEAPVQALELWFSRLCGLGFHFSADNPGADGGRARQVFEADVLDRFHVLCRRARDGGLAADTAAVATALNPRWARFDAAADHPATCRSGSPGASGP